MLGYLPVRGYSGVWRRSPSIFYFPFYKRAIEKHWRRGRRRRRPEETSRGRGTERRRRQTEVRAVTKQIGRRLSPSRDQERPCAGGGALAVRPNSQERRPTVLGAPLELNLVDRVLHRRFSSVRFRGPIFPLDLYLKIVYVGDLFGGRSVWRRTRSVDPRSFVFHTRDRYIWGSWNISSAWSIPWISIKWYRFAASESLSENNPRFRMTAVSALSCSSCWWYQRNVSSRIALSRGAKKEKKKRKKKKKLRGREMCRRRRSEGETKWSLNDDETTTISPCHPASLRDHLDTLDPVTCWNR